MKTNIYNIPIYDEWHKVSNSNCIGILLVNWIIKPYKIKTRYLSNKRYGLTLHINDKNK